MENIEGLQKRLDALHASIESLERRVSRIGSGCKDTTSTTTSSKAVASQEVSSHTPSVAQAVNLNAVASSSTGIYVHEEYLPTGTCTDIVTDNEKRMYQISQEQGFSSSVFVRCPSDYYSWRLEQRRQKLNAPSVHHLCKSIVMANTKCPHDNFSNRKDSKYYLIVVQYTARLHNERLGQAVRSLHEVPPSRKLFNFRLVSPEKNDELTGFSHNGVTPIGCKEKLPVIISDRLIALNPPFIWLGAGEPDLKWRVSLQDLMEHFDPIVANITYDEVNEDPEPTH